MNIQELLALVDEPLIEAVLASFAATPVSVARVSATPATFPWLDNGESNNAYFLRLDVQYRDNTRLPRQLVLKAARNVGDTAVREMRFFQLNKAATDDSTGLIRCYGAIWSERLDLGLFALEHGPEPALIYDGPESAHLPQYRHALAALADLHARWWNAPGLGKDELAAQWTPPFLASVTPAMLAGLETLHQQTDTLCASEYDRLQQAFENMHLTLPKMVQAAEALTLVHGDAALWNFVLPVDARKPAKLVDFQTWHVGLPAWDVAYMILLLWPEAFRRQHAAAMYDSYLEHLALRGVTYSPRQLLRDLGDCLAPLAGLTLANYTLGLWPMDSVAERVRRLLDAMDEIAEG